MRKLWNKEEIIFLRKLYEIDGLSITELYAEFNEKYNRSKTSVNVKIGKLKLKHSKKQISEIKSRLFSGKGNGMYDKISPLKGLNKETSNIIRNKSIKLSETRKKMFKDNLLPNLKGKNNPMYGKDSWNKGKNKYTDKRIHDYGLKISKIKKEWWGNLNEYERDKIIDRLNKIMIQNNKVTKIETIIDNYLTSKNITFIRNKKIGRFYVDFYLPKFNLVIEADGDYWHANPEFYLKNKLSDTQIKNIERDNRKNLLLKKRNFNLIRFWEHDIIYKFENVKKEIWEQLQKK